MLSRFPAAFRQPGFALSGHPFLPGTSAPLTVGLPRRHQRRGPDRFSVFRTRETRLDLGALCTPGAAVPARPVIVPGRRLPHLSGRPCTLDCDPSQDVMITRHQQGFTVVHPTPAFPSPVAPDGTGSSGFPLSSTPSRAGPSNACQGGDGPGHCPDYVPGISQPPSTLSLTTCDLTSQQSIIMSPGHGTRPAGLGKAGCSCPRPRPPPPVTPHRKATPLHR